MRKALILASAVVLAACSRNPEPGVDETGRADTAAVTDTGVTPQVDTAQTDLPGTDTTTFIPTDTTTMQPDTSTATPPINNTDTTTVTPDTGVTTDTSATDTPAVDTSATDTSNTGADSAHVSHEAEKFEGDSALIERDTPDTAQQNQQSQ